jgi:hypothetical protein
MANKPVHEIRLGHVKAVIWANETQAGTRHNINVARLFKDGDNWSTSDTFGRDDLPLVAKVADLAHTWIFVQTQNGLGSSDRNGGSKREARSGQRR